MNKTVGVVVLLCSTKKFNFLMLMSQVDLHCVFYQEQMAELEYPFATYQNTILLMIFCEEVMKSLQFHVLHLLHQVELKSLLVIYQSLMEMDQVLDYIVPC